MTSRPNLSLVVINLSIPGVLALLVPVLASPASSDSFFLLQSNVTFVSGVLLFYQVRLSLEAPGQGSRVGLRRDWQIFAAVVGLLGTQYAKPGGQLSVLEALEFVSLVVIVGLEAGMVFRLSGFLMAGRNRDFELSQFVGNAGMLAAFCALLWIDERLIGWCFLARVATQWGWVRLALPASHAAASSPSSPSTFRRLGTPILIGNKFLPVLFRVLLSAFGEGIVSIFSVLVNLVSAAVAVVDRAILRERLGARANAIVAQRAGLLLAHTRFLGGCSVLVGVGAFGYLTIMLSLPLTSAAILSLAVPASFLMTSYSQALEYAFAASGRTVSFMLLGTASSLAGMVGVLFGAEGRPMGAILVLLLGPRALTALLGTLVSRET